MEASGEVSCVLVCGHVMGVKIVICVRVCCGGFMKSDHVCVVCGWMTDM